jgi:hypothetical protein
VPAAQQRWDVPVGGAFRQFVSRHLRQADIDDGKVEASGIDRLGTKGTGADAFHEGCKLVFKRVNQEVADPRVPLDNQYRRHGTDLSAKRPVPNPKSAVAGGPSFGTPAICSVAC